jgi:hypothetical protein
MSYFCSVRHWCRSETSIFTQIMTSVPVTFCLWYRAFNISGNQGGYNARKQTERSCG